MDVAQDDAVAAGLANATREEGIFTVGPSKEAGQIEWDKVWSRGLMQRAGILQPEFHTFSSAAQGREFIEENADRKCFVKAAGLAAGKGAIPAKSTEDALRAIEEIQRYGKAYLIEEWIEGDDGTPGEEFSAFAYSDGKTWQFVGYAQDHKRAFNGDNGPNTGGMGCVSSPLIIDRKIDKKTQEIFGRIFAQLQKENRPYQGILYFGGMVVNRNGEPAVYAVECNARWGDPEAEVIVPSIQNDFFELNMAVAQGQLRSMIQTDGKTRVSITVASKGYPGDYSDVKGKRIDGLEKAQQLPGITIFGAGLRRNGNNFVVSGGRIVHVVAEGSTTTKANALANQAADLIRVEGKEKENLAYHRRDIGWRDIQRSLLSTV